MHLRIYMYIKAHIFCSCVARASLHCMCIAIRVYSIAFMPIWTVCKCTYTATHMYIYVSTPRIVDARSQWLRVLLIQGRWLRVSLKQGVVDSAYHWCEESPREFFLENSALLPIRGVVDSAYQWYGEWMTPRIVDTGSRRWWFLVHSVNF